MLKICPKCGLSFCDCVIEPTAPPKRVSAPKPQPRQISKKREFEIKQLIEELRTGRIDPEEAKRLYKDMQNQLHVEIALLKDLSTEIYGQSKKDYSFDDFPLKD